MKAIQLDMYAVGLGAAILTQFRSAAGETVSILADGGMGTGGYPQDGVHDRLDDAFRSFDKAGRPARLDLVVGTHYDSDHLKGLIPIAADDAIEIGEVWLPPVKDDADEIPGHVSEEEDFLALKFYGEGHEEALQRYLEEKRRQVEDLSSAESRLVNTLREQENAGARHLPFFRVDIAMERRDLHEQRPETPGDYVQYFEWHEANAAAVTGGDGAHASSRYDSTVKDIRDLARDARHVRARDTFARILEREGYLKDDPASLRMMPGILASIRKSTAAGAITASNLYKLVQALKARRTPVRPRCNYITAGKPIRFAWNATKRRFVPGNGTGTSEPVLTLLGPSDLLVEKHREKLPVGSYLFAVSLARSPIRLEGITESNQLSYIFTIETAGQRVLISGDAGCYGFKDEHGNYWQPLLDALSPLHVVQVAHHAGHNYDFYNTLLAAGLAEQEGLAYLLVSHEVHDRTRPSNAFGQFVAQLRGQRDEKRLLFTSEPDAIKVQNYDELICRVVPAGLRASHGDVRMSYLARQGVSGWGVEMHSVAV